MSKTWLFNFICVLMICLPSHCMHSMFNIGPETRLMRSIRNASEFLNKNGWTIFATGTVVATLCCYDKPVLWHAGVVGFNGLLMYKFIQMQKQMNALAQTLEETNNKVINQNDTFQRNLDDIKKEQGEQKEVLGITGKEIAGLLPKINACEQSITGRLNSFNKENIDPLRGDIKVASAELGKLSESIVRQGEQQAALDKNVNDLHTLLTNIGKKQETMVEDHTSRFTAIEEKIETGFARLDTSIATSLNEIKERLIKKGVAWQGNKQIGFGRQAAVGVSGSLNALLKCNTSTP